MAFLSLERQSPAKRAKISRKLAAVPAAIVTPTAIFTAASSMEWPATPLQTSSSTPNATKMAPRDHRSKVRGVGIGSGARMPFLMQEAGLALSYGVYTPTG